MLVYFYTLKWICDLALHYTHSHAFLLRKMLRKIIIIKKSYTLNTVKMFPSDLTSACLTRVLLSACCSPVSTAQIAAKPSAYFKDQDCRNTTSLHQDGIIQTFITELRAQQITGAARNSRLMCT